MPGRNKRRRGAPDAAGAQASEADAVLEAIDDESGAVDADIRAKLKPEALSNAQFETYYRQVLGLDEAEWALFLQVMRQPLPSTFRINPFGSQTMRATRQIQQIVGKIPPDAFPIKDTDGAVVAKLPPRPMAWLPQAWDAGTDRASLRKVPVYRELHEVLVRMSETGTVARQEIVSMLPPLVLDVQGGHWVVDLCASPGSKSLQILETLERASPGQGLLVANDVNSKRAYMLSHRLKPIKSAGLILTTHDASMFPGLSNGGDGTFDRVLADVPCTGDGTLRKNVLLWKGFKLDDAKILHPLQLRIALQGFQILKPGGLLVYSTCSLNPIEDEAVVAELLRQAGPAAELVDRSLVLAGFKVRLGSSQWPVPVVHDNGQVSLFASSSEVERWAQGTGVQVPEIKPTMFAQEDCSGMHLERCMRILPHDQDTGGFFVACIRKLKSWPGDKPARGLLPVPSTRMPKGKNPNDVWFDEVDDATWKSVKDNWGLPDAIRRNFQVRCARGDKETEHAQKEANKIVWINNDALALFDRAASTSASVHFVNAGVVVLHRSGKDGAGYRITNAGASLLLPYVTKRIVHLNLANLQTLFDTSKSPQGFLPSVRVEDLPQNEASRLGSWIGGLLFLLDPPSQLVFEQKMGGRFCLAGWYGGKANVSSMVDKNDFFELFNQMLAEGMIHEVIAAPVQAKAV